MAEMTNAEALSMAIFALNTLAHPEGSSDEDMDRLDEKSDEVIDRLIAIRDQPPAAVAELFGLVETWRAEAIKLYGDREENETCSDEVDDGMASTYEDCASQVMFRIAPLDPKFDTESSASRQHFIETGNYIEKEG